MSRVRMFNHLYAGLLVCACAGAGTAAADLNINPYPNQPEEIQQAIEASTQQSENQSEDMTAQEAPIDIISEVTIEESIVIEPDVPLEPIAESPPEPAIPNVPANTGPQNLESFDIDAYYAAFAKQPAVVAATSQKKTEPSYEIEALSEDELGQDNLIPMVTAKDSEPVFEAKFMDEATPQSPSEPEAIIVKKEIVHVPVAAPAAPDPQNAEALKRLEMAVHELRADIIAKEEAPAPAVVTPVDTATLQELEKLKAQNAALEAKVAEIDALKEKTSRLEAEIIEAELESQYEPMPQPAAIEPSALEQLEQKVAKLERNNQKLEADLQSAKQTSSIPPKPFVSKDPVSVDAYYGRYANNAVAQDRPLTPDAPLQARMSEPQFVAEEFVMEEATAIKDAPAYEVAAYEPSAPSQAQETVFLTDQPLRHDWRALRGKSVRDILAGWSDKAGVQFVWDTGNQFAVLDNFDINGTYEGAVEGLLAQYGESDTRPVASLHIDPETGERILVVQASNNL